MLVAFGIRCAILLLPLTFPEESSEKLQDHHAQTGLIRTLRAIAIVKALFMCATRYNETMDWRCNEDGSAAVSEQPAQVVSSGENELAISPARATSGRVFVKMYSLHGS